MVKQFRWYVDKISNRIKQALRTPLDIDLENKSIKNLGNIDFDTSYADGVQEGRLNWNIEDGTLNLGMPGGVVNLQIGQEFLSRVKNTSGGTLLNGTAVCVTGISGSNLEVGKADKNSLAKAVILGVTTEEIDHNHFGMVNTAGWVRELNTLAYPPGTFLFLQDNGLYSTTRPEAPGFTIGVGVSGRQHIDEGTIYVRPVYLQRMNYASDVHIRAQTLKWGEGPGWDTANNRYDIGSGWTDLKAPAIPSQKNPAVANPTYNYTELAWNFRNSNDDGPINGAFQADHGWDYSATIYPHIHWIQTQAGVPYYELVYRIIQHGQAIPGWTTVYSTGNKFAYSAGTIGQMSTFAPIDTSTLTNGISAIIDFKVRRLATDPSDTYETDLLFKEFDIHVRLTRKGTRYEASD